MKVEQESEKFKPFKLLIETEEEALCLLASLSTSDSDKVKAASCEHSEFSEIEKAVQNNSSMMYEIIEEIVNNRLSLMKKKQG